MEYINLLIKLRSPIGRLVDGLIVVRDEFALAKFSDPNLAQQLYDADKKDGLDVFYSEERNTYIQRYKGKGKDEIITIISKELEKSGGKIITKDEAKE